MIDRTKKILTLALAFVMCFSLCACEEMLEETKYRYVGTYFRDHDTIRISENFELYEDYSSDEKMILVLYDDLTGKYYERGKTYEIVANVTWRSGDLGEIALSIEGVETNYEYREGSDQIVEDFSQHTYFREYECGLGFDDGGRELRTFRDYKGQTVTDTWLTKKSDTPVLTYPPLTTDSDQLVLTY